MDLMNEYVYLMREKKEDKAKTCGMQWKGKRTRAQAEMQEIPS